MTDFIRLTVAILAASLWWWPGLVTLAPAESPSRMMQMSAMVEMQPGQIYGAGTRVRVPKGTASFVIPAGWHGQIPADSDAIIIVSESGAGFIMAFTILHLTESELIALLSESQPVTHDLVFEPVGDVVREGDRLTASYRAGTLAGRALTVMGSNQQGILFFLGGPPTESDQPERILGTLADSTEFVPTK